MAPITLRLQIAEVERELAMRRRVYPLWIQRGNLTAPEAEDRTRRLEAALATLKHLSEERFKAEAIASRSRR